MLLYTCVSYWSLTDLHVFMYDIDNQVVYFMCVFHVPVARYQPHLVLLVSVRLSALILSSGSMFSDKNYIF